MQLLLNVKMTFFGFKTLQCTMLGIFNSFFSDLIVLVHHNFNKNCHKCFLLNKTLHFCSMPEVDNRGGLPRHIHPQGDDRGMDRGEGQLLKLVSFILS